MISFVKLFPNNLGIVSQFSTGVPIIYIFVVPISFIVYDILISNTFDKLLVVKFALIIILIIYSHFLTIIVLGLITLGIMINNIIMHKFHIASIVNVIVGVILGLVGCIPIIYRCLLFNNIGLVMPFGQGKIITLSHFPFISKINFIVIVFLCLLPYFNFNGIYDNRSNYYQLLAIEIYIYIYTWLKYFSMVDYSKITLYKGFTIFR